MRSRWGAGWDPAVAWNLACIGASVFLLVAAGSAIWSGLYLLRSERSVASVTGVVERDDGRGGAAAFLELTYRVGPDGEFRNRVGISDPDGYRLGDAVPVRYLVTFPGESRLDSFSGLWGGPVFFGSLGCAFVGWAWLLSWRRRGGRAQSL